MNPPIAAKTSKKKKLIKDMAKLTSLLTPTLEKKNIVLASRRPKPTMDIGKKVIAPIIGRNIKKQAILVSIPKDKEIK